MASESNKRIAKNTLMLYFRMLISMIVALYTSRVVLNTLGVTDFGIYNIVGGIVAMFSLINGSMSSASQRFITFELGKKEKQRSKEVFSTIVTIHSLMAVIVFILAETIGLWFLNVHLNISHERIEAANWVYQCSVLTFIIEIISVPYNASIIAHEHMKAFAYIGILEVVLKLLIVFLLVFFPFDKLVLYSILILTVYVIIRFIYGYYCKRHFEECTFQFKWDKKLFKGIAGFAGWNFIGASSVVLMNQGVNILLNIFYGVLVNSAQGIASQVQNAIGSFISSFMTALNPQITKSYASGDCNYTLKLIQMGARYSFYLMFLLSLPVIIETEIILKIWLKVVPHYTVIFVRLSLLIAILQTLSTPLITAMLASGRVKTYQIVVGGIQLLNFPLSYIALKIGLSPQSTLIISFFVSIACLIARLLLLKNMINLSITDYLKHVIFNVLSISFLSAIIPSIVHFYMSNNVLRFFYVSGISILSTILIIYFIGFSIKERIFINEKVLKIIKEKTPFNALIKND